MGSELSWKAFHYIQSKIQEPEPSQLLLTPRLLSSTHLSHISPGTPLIPRTLDALPHLRALHILVPLPKLPLFFIFPWPTLPQASEVSSLHPPIKEDYSSFTLKLPVLFLPSAELTYWISILQTLCFLQGRIMSVLLTSVYLVECKETCRCSIDMNR